MFGRLLICCSKLRDFSSINSTRRGRLLTGWLKFFPSVRWVMEAGRWSTGELKLSPKMRRISEGGRRLSTR